MTFLETWRSPTVSTFDPEKALRLQVGALSPLWLPIGAAAMTGLAIWSLTRWMRLATPEGAAEAEAPVEAASFAPIEPEPVVEALEAIPELAAETVAEPLIESAPLLAEPAAEPVAEVPAVMAAEPEPLPQPVAAPPKAKAPAKAKPPASLKRAEAVIAKPKAPPRKPRPTAH